MPTFTSIIQNIFSFFETFVRWIIQFNRYTHSQFGIFAQVALNLLIFYFLFLLVSRVVKAMFDLTRYVILPSVILSGITSFILPYGFLTLLPFFIGVLIVINLLRS
jgi:hypothetical protein